MPQTSRTLGDLETMLLLRRVPLFEGLAPEDLQRIALAAAEHLYPPDDAIVREGDLGDELVVIVEGSVRVVHVEPDGQRAAHPSLRGGRPHRRAGRPARGTSRGDRHRGGRRRSRPRHRRRRAQGDPARTTGRRDGDAGHPRRADRHAASVRRDDRRRPRPAPAPDRDGHVPAHRRRGLDAARPGARIGLGRAQRHAPGDRSATPSRPTAA